MSVLQKAKNGEILYCALFARRCGPNPFKDWEQDELYFHAKDIEDARVKFWKSDDPRVLQGIRLIDIAPSVGWFCDSNGENLIAQ